MKVKMELEILCDAEDMDSILKLIKKIDTVENVQFERAYPR